MFDQALYDYAMSFVGRPYMWGGDDPMEGFDCSGLVIELLKSVDLLPRVFDTTSQGLYDHFFSSSLELKVPRFGALCFYGRSLKRITHVGMAIDSFRLIEAGGGNSLTRSEKKASEQNAFVRIRPINSRRDLVAILMPPYEKRQLS